MSSISSTPVFELKGSWPTEHLYNYIYNHLGKIGGNYFEIGSVDGVSIATVARRFFFKTIVSLNETTSENFAYNTNGLTNVESFVMSTDQFAASLTQEKLDFYQVCWITVGSDNPFQNGDLAIKLIDKRHGIIAFNGTQGSQEFIEKYKDRIVYSAEVNDGTSVLVEIKGTDPNALIVK